MNGRTRARDFSPLDRFRTAHKNISNHAIEHLGIDWALSENCSYSNSRCSSCVCCLLMVCGGGAAASVAFVCVRARQTSIEFSHCVLRIHTYGMSSSANRCKCFCCFIVVPVFVPHFLIRIHSVASKSIKLMALGSCVVRTTFIHLRTCVHISEFFFSSLLLFVNIFYSMGARERAPSLFVSSPAQIYL